MVLPAHPVCQINHPKTFAHILWELFFFFSFSFDFFSDVGNGSIYYNE